MKACVAVLGLMCVFAGCIGGSSKGDGSIAVKQAAAEPVVDGTCSVVQQDSGAQINCSDGSSAVVSNGAPTFSTSVDSQGCTVVHAISNGVTTDIGTVCAPEAKPQPDTQVIRWTGGGRYATSDFASRTSAISSNTFPETVIGSIEIVSEGEWFELRLNKSGSCSFWMSSSSEPNTFDMTTNNMDPSLHCGVVFKGLEGATFDSGTFGNFLESHNQGDGVFYLPSGTHTLSLVIPSFNLADNVSRIRFSGINYTFMGTLRRLHQTSPAP